MYNSQEIALKIKSRLKLLGISSKKMLDDLGMGINTISEFAKGKQISYLSLAKIADYLGCSVDYLLGRDTIGSLTDKQKWLLDSYEKLSDEYRRLIDRKLEQYAAEDEEYRVFEEIKERKKKRMIENLSEEKNISAPSAKK